MYAQNITLINNNNDEITINRDLHFTLNGVFYATKTAQNRKNAKTGENTNSCYVSIKNRGTVSFSGEGVKDFFDNAEKSEKTTTARIREKNADCVKVIAKYDTLDEFIAKNADAQKMTRIRGTASIDEYTADVVRKIDDLQKVLASMTSEYTQIHALTDEEFKQVIEDKYAKNNATYEKAVLAKNSKNDLVNIAKTQADKIAELEALLAKMQAQGTAK